MSLIMGGTKPFSINKDILSCFYISTYHISKKSCCHGDYFDLCLKWEQLKFIMVNLLLSGSLQTSPLPGSFVSWPLWLRPTSSFASLSTWPSLITYCLCVQMWSQVPAGRNRSGGSQSSVSGKLLLSPHSQESCMKMCSAQVQSKHMNWVEFILLWEPWHTWSRQSSNW